jgi:hypothetical protein
MTFAEHVLKFYQSLDLSTYKLPAGVEVLNPYQDKTAFDLTQKLFTKFITTISRAKSSSALIREGLAGGMTGIPFTDPIRLEKVCGIPNNLPKKPELSSGFIYRMIEVFGGPEKFYRKYFFSSVSPLGFTKDGKNLNYYDQKDLQEAVYPFIIESIKKQLTFNISTDVAFVWVKVRIINSCRP